MNLSNISRTHLVIGGIVLLALVAAIAAYMYLKPASSEGVVLTSNEEAVATSTPSGEAGGKSLPVEPTFTLPEGAQALDDYAYTKDDSVYFRSITSTEPLRIPDADAGTFKRLANFMTYSANSVVGDCGGTALYTYYADEDRVYFYQIWRTDFFRTSQIEVLAGTKAKDFRITGPLTATDGIRSVTVGHRQTATTSTCLLILNRTDR